MNDLIYALAYAALGAIYLLRCILSASETEKAIEAEEGYL